MSLETEANAAAEAAKKRAQDNLAPTIASWTSELSKWNPEVDKYDPAKLGASLRSFYELHKATAVAANKISAKLCRGSLIADFTSTTDQPVGYLCDLGVRQNLLAEAYDWLNYSAKAVKEFGQYIEQCDKMAAENALVSPEKRLAIQLKNLRPVIQRCTMGLYYAMVSANAAADIRMTSWMGKAVVSALNGDIAGVFLSIMSGVKQGITMIVSAAFTAVGKVVGFAANVATDALFAILKKVGLYAAIGIGGYIVVKRAADGRLLGDGK